MKEVQNTIADIKRDYGEYLFEGVNPHMKLATYLKKIGMRELAKVLKIVEDTKFD